MSRVITGAIAAEAGQSFESALERAHAIFAAHGLARIRQLPVPTVPCGQEIRSFLVSRYGREKGLGMAGRMRQRSARQGYDFSGVFGPNAGPDDEKHSLHGIAIAMEAKSNSSKSTNLRIIPADSTDSGGIKEHQLDALADEYRDWGTVSAIVWRNGGQGYVLTPDMVLAARDRFRAGGRKSIPVDEFTAYELFDYPDEANVEDWIFPLRCWLSRYGRPSPALSRMKVFEMVQYQFDQQTREVCATDDDGTRLRTTMKVGDRQMLEQLARESRTPAEFIEKVQRVGSANE